MYLTQRSVIWASAAPSLPPLYIGTRLTEAIAAATKGSKEWNCSVYFVETGKELGDANLLFTAFVGHLGSRQEWHDKAAEAECRNRAIPGLIEIEEKKSKTAPT